ncbi:PocR ligand-binding domain-containing protein [uncultured Ilyobacter sp.]|uniref:PocR ligand-binding domain-containing protein n=1 Tax=uncultured Ilyobacter sp. TaxID=544433 RepID=UPI0029C076B4|nr:PocR ligand-binding domain-containing protein [uncultured Ilyobacter sp.]
MNNLANDNENSLDVEFFQILQDRLSKEFQISSVITDVNGFPITKPSNFTEFCGNHTRKTELGLKKCMLCDSYGGTKAMLLKKPIVYKCHAGLIDFASPILMGDKLIGCFLCGQVLSEKPDKEKFIGISKEFGIDPDEYLEAVDKIKILPYEEIEYIANFVYKISSKISDFTYYQDVGIASSKNLKKSTDEFNFFLENIEETSSSSVGSDFKFAVKNLFLRISETLFKNFKSDDAKIFSINKHISSISNETSKIDTKLKETKENFETMTASLFTDKK